MVRCIVGGRVGWRQREVLDLTYYCLRNTISRWRPSGGGAGSLYTGGPVLAAQGPPGASIYSMY